MMKKKKQQVLILEEFKLGFKDLGSGFRVQRRPELCWGYFVAWILDASFFAEEEAEAGPFFWAIEVRIQRFGFRA
jgi:hypothetical protein